MPSPAAVSATPIWPGRPMQLASSVPGASQGGNNPANRQPLAFSNGLKALCRPASPV